MEQAASRPVELEHKHHGRKLHGVPLWLARGTYIFLFLLVLMFFFGGLKNFAASWSTGNIGAVVSANGQGQLILNIYPSSDAAGAGIQTGDILQAINGKLVTSAAEANQLLSGQLGQAVSLTVLSRHQFPRQVDLAYGGGFLKLIGGMHLSARFLYLYNLIFSCLLAAGVILSSPLVFFRRSNDWLVILVAFAMIAFASYLLSPVGFGAARFHIYFMNNLIYMAGMVAMIIVFLVFPTGHFEPRWTRWLSLLLFIPAVVDFYNLQKIGNSLLDFYLWIGFFALSVFSQLYRYQKVSNATERQQTKRVVLGAVACFTLIALLELATFLLAPRLTYAQYILFYLVVKAGSTLPVLILDLSFALAIYRYRLWDTDLYINRTLVYTLVTFALILVWVVTTQVLNYASQQLLGKQAGWLGALLSSLQIAVIYKPVRTWTEKWVNKRFYKDRIDYEKALVELQPSMWAFLTPLDLIHTLVTKVPSLLQSTSAALFMEDRYAFTLTEVQDMHPYEANKFQFSPEIVKKLEKGEALNLPEGEPFKLLVPLTIPRLQVYDLVAVLAFGPRTKGRGYSRDHLADLTSLGRSAGTALHMLQLYEKKQSREMTSGMTKAEP